MSLDIYDRQGEPIDSATWTALQRRDYKEIGNTTIRVREDEVCVSTVWLGLNHRHGDGPPIIFETMVFRGALDGACDRYSTDAEARAGHETMCAKVRAS